MFNPLKVEKGHRQKGLIDNGASASAMTADFFEKLESESSNTISELQ